MDLTPTLVLALFAAGVVGGIVSVLVSLASLVTYPALLAAGLPPVAANVTNTVAQTFTSVGASIGARSELNGQSPTLRRLAIVAAAGGATGAALLLVTHDLSIARQLPTQVQLTAINRAAAAPQEAAV